MAVSKSSHRVGTLFVNLGSPDSPSTPDVRRYLAQFLMDKRVIDAPFFIRFIIVYLFILPFRPQRSGEAYASIWTKEGSPLIAISNQTKALVEPSTSAPLSLGMRYGSPSIREGIKDLLNQSENKLKTLQLLPLYPHYAMSSFETVIVETKEQLQKLAPKVTLKICPPFYQDNDYIQALSATIKPYLKKKPDYVLFSYHGLPERHLKKTDPTGHHCLKQMDCCNTPSKAHKTCYLHQSIKTTELTVKALKLKQPWSIAFQSRLGRDKWLLPNTENEIIRLAKNGIKTCLVICPSFVADCLETLEEIQIRGNELFQEHGGKELILVPCLNTNNDWIHALQRWVCDPSRFVSEKKLGVTL